MSQSLLFLSFPRLRPRTSPGIFSSFTPLFPVLAIAFTPASNFGFKLDNPLFLFGYFFCQHLPLDLDAAEFFFQPGWVGGDDYGISLAER